MKKTAVITSLAMALSGCATSSDKIAASYVSPIHYQNMDCTQIASEMERVRSAAISSGAQVDKAANNDAGIMAAGMILFWPALFFLGGNQAKEAEYAKLKGESEALDRVAVEKKCANTERLQPPSDEAAEKKQPTVQKVEHITITSTEQPDTRHTGKQQ